MKPGAGSLKTNNKIDKLAILNQEKKKFQINKITNERGEITYNTTDINSKKIL